MPCLGLCTLAGPAWDFGSVGRNLYETKIHNLHFRFQKAWCFQPLSFRTVFSCRSAEAPSYSFPVFSSGTAAAQIQLTKRNPPAARAMVASCPASAHTLRQWVSPVWDPKRAPVEESLSAAAPPLEVDLAL